MERNDLDVNQSVTSMLSFLVLISEWEIKESKTIAVKLDSETRAQMLSFAVSKASFK